MPSKMRGEIYHLGFSNMESVYCSECHKVLLLADPDFLLKNGANFPSLLLDDKG